MQLKAGLLSIYLEICVLCVERAIWVCVLPLILSDFISFFHFIFNSLGMVAPQLKRSCFTGGHAFNYSKNLINNSQLMNTNKKKLRNELGW